MPLAAKPATAPAKPGLDVARWRNAARRQASGPIASRGISIRHKRALSPTSSAALVPVLPPAFHLPPSAIQRSGIDNPCRRDAGDERCSGNCAAGAWRLPIPITIFVRRTPNSAAPSRRASTGGEYPSDQTARDQGWEIETYHGRFPKFAEWMEGAEQGLHFRPGIGREMPATSDLDLCRVAKS